MVILSYKLRSTMNSVLGFESGLIDISVRNAVGSTLKSAIAKSLGVSIVTGTNYSNSEL